MITTNKKLLAYLLLFLTLSCGSEEDVRKTTKRNQQEDDLAQSISLVTNPKFKAKNYLCSFAKHHGSIK